MRRAGLAAVLLALLTPHAALAWGHEGHKITAMIARALLTPAARAKADAILATDGDTLTGSSFVARSTWADAYRSSNRDTASWHFVDIELDHPDLAAACFNFPKVSGDASHGPANDCIVDKIDEFAAELANPKTNPSEQQLALKFILHFVGDLHQPLHAADNHDHGGNCVQVSLGGIRSTNLHSYWDTAVVEMLGPDEGKVAQALLQSITPDQRVEWEKGDTRAWAMESFAVAQQHVYTINSAPGCGGDHGPVALPSGYDQNAAKVAATQLQKAGVRLALVLNRALT